MPDGFKPRTILTIYGPVTYKRRIYKYWDEYRYRYVFLADKKLQVERYSRITSHLKFKILEQIATGKRQRDICDMFSFAKFSRATIKKIVNSFDFQEPLNIVFDNYSKVKIPQYLYINMDETYIKLRKNKKLNKYRIRLVTFHTGYHKFYSSVKRKVLANKRVFFQILPISKRIDTAEFSSNVEKMAHKFYSNVATAKVIIGGDGAPWIRNASQYWPNTDYVLDKFHALRYLKQLFPTKNNLLNQQQYQASKTLFESGTYFELLQQLKQAIIKPEKAKKLKEVMTYFRNNATGIINQSLDYNIGVSAEGDISHIIKWLLGYGTKAFNYQTFKNMLLVQTAEINQLDILSYLKSEYQEEKAREQQFLKKILDAKVLLIMLLLVKCH
ncbi:MAG: Mbov_0401 family ICE element transposase-like protein [Spiroplasma sp.]